MGMKIKGLHLQLGSVALLALAAVTLKPASADTQWTQWTSASQAGFVVGGGGTAAGAMGAITVTYTGNYDAVIPLTNTPVYIWPSEYSTTWSPGSSYVNGTTVTSAPPTADGVIQLQGGGAIAGNVDTITFSSPVTDPLIAIWSLGQNGVTAAFDFEQTPTIVAGGPSTEYVGGSITNPSGNIIAGAEGNGTVEFVGTYSSISWTNPDFEFWYGFTVGEAAVPEAGFYSILGMLALGFLGVWAFSRRKCIAGGI